MNARKRDWWLGPGSYRDSNGCSASRYIFVNRLDVIYNIKRKKNSIMPRILVETARKTISFD